ncbi:MAG: BrnT family toxin [Candidatus Magasanikbacteria bacterium]|nr:BrnT family toxin [Candidatus Magasanikbacteria bacterium]
MVIWDPQKNKKLKRERGVSFEEVETIILARDFLATEKNPTRLDQRIFIVRLYGYVHVVPYVRDEKRNIILKTIYPSRKFHKLYS